MKFLLPFIGLATAAILPRQDASALPGSKAAPRLEAQQVRDGGTRVRVKVGTYNLPANGMTTTIAADGKAPCKDCYVTAVQANLLYQDGSEANVDTGAWLHHIVLTGIPEPGMMWACGNERPTLRLNSQYKYGWHFPSNIMYSIMVDLMSSSNQNKVVDLVLDYEYIPSAKATGYKAAAMEWLQIGEPAAKTGKFSFNSQSWTSNINAKLLYAIGHMHDGGTNSQLFKNNVEICRSIMLYNERPHYNVPVSTSSMPGMAAGGAHSHATTADGFEWHISSPGVCENFGTVKRGDVLRMVANYDADKYGLMMHNGQAERLMGNMRVYMGPE